LSNPYDVFVLDVQKLAAEAEERIEDTDPPLFLRFINLLINDAIFLLDEAFDVSSYYCEI
jgi:ubiquitin conjugation factor E4 A